MNPIHFTIMTLLGTIGWSGILIYIGYSIGPYWSSAGAAITNALTDLILYGAVAISAFYIAFFVYRGASRADARRG
jgi:membrane protein DedA with SNARE-associated domain